MKPEMKRATVYLDPKIHRALKIKAVQVSRSISDLVNEAIRNSLSEDFEDLEAFESRLNEPNLDFEYVLKDLKASGKI
jgi:plasmid stability protein